MVIYLDESKQIDKEQLKEKRVELLSQINALLDFPLTLLSILWLVLIIVDFVYGFSPFLQTLSLVIWGVFIVDFLVELEISPGKKDYLKKNWLVVLSLFLPALRVLTLFSGFRLVRFANFVRALNLARILSSFNRSPRTVRQVMRQRGLRYVLLLTMLITFLGTSDIYDFERPRLTLLGCFLVDSNDYDNDRKRLLARNP